jgi:hypothetical protein
MVFSVSMNGLYAEIKEEALDFFEDFGEILFHFRRHPRTFRQLNIGGLVTTVRPAYLFAERIDNCLKLIFAASIIVSACTASFVGFIKLSDLLEVLMFTTPGRVLMGCIGGASLITSLWRLLSIKDAPQSQKNIPPAQSTIHNDD